MITREEFLKKLVESQESLKRARGEILQRFNEIENLVTAILTAYYAKADKQSEFTFNFLGDSSIPTSAKINVLAKLPLIKSLQLCTNLKQMSNIRNNIVHSTPFGTEKQIINSKTGKPTKIEELEREFNKFYNVVAAELEKILFDNFCNQKS